MKIHLCDINLGNNLFESRMQQLQDRSKYSDKYLINHIILVPDFISFNVVTFKLQDGNHAFAEYIRRYPALKIVEIPDNCFDCSNTLLEKYEEKCL